MVGVGVPSSPHLPAGGSDCFLSPHSASVEGKDHFVPQQMRMLRFPGNCAMKTRPKLCAP